MSSIAVALNFVPLPPPPVCVSQQIQQIFFFFFFFQFHSFDLVYVIFVVRKICVWFNELPKIVCLSLPAPTRIAKQYKNRSSARTIFEASSMRNDNGLYCSRSQLPRWFFRTFTFRIMCETISKLFLWLGKCLRALGPFKFRIDWRTVFEVEVSGSFVDVENVKYRLLPELRHDFSETNNTNSIESNVRAKIGY